MSRTIRAAGGLVWRGTPRSPQIAVIHRPHRADWSLPKGKLDAHESVIAGAVREVVEETGLHVAVQQQLGPIRYRIDGVPKVVNFWAMRHLGGEFVPNDEADTLLWLDPRDAVERLTYRGDRKTVDRFTARPAPDSAVLLIRHAKAGKRSAWKKEDVIRPIDSDGRHRARALAEFGPLFAPTVIGAATPLRCQQTVQPLAERLGQPVEAMEAFSDKAFEHRPRTTVRALKALARTRRVTAVCSQGNTITGLLDSIGAVTSDATSLPPGPHESRKGSAWALFFARGELVHADYYRRPS